MSHTRILTFLGRGKYRKSKYKMGDVITSSTTMHDVATTLHYGVDECSLVMLATPEVKEDWFDDQDEYRKELRKHKAMPRLFGLRDISDGLEEGTQMDNFRTLLRCLNPEPLELVDHEGEKTVEPGEPGEIVLDITHGWRSLPFFAAAVVRFARSQALRNQRKSNIRIIYSAFNPKEELTPVCDLTSLVDVGDWDTALDVLMRYGRADDFAVLSKEDQRKQRKKTALGQLGNLVKAFADALVTTRTDQVITKASGDFLARLGELKQEAIAQSPMLEGQIEKLLQWGEALHAPQTISHEGLRAGVELTRLLIQLQRYAEAFATMRELLVTAWTLATIPEGEILQPGQSGIKQQRGQVERDMSLRACAKDTDPLLTLYKKISERRNDLLHGGFTNQPFSAKHFRDDAPAYLEELEALLDQGPRPVTGPALEGGVMVNFSNHPQTTWSGAQMEAARALGSTEVLDVPFPEVDPEASLQDVQALAHKMAEAIAAHQPKRVFVAGEPTLAACVVKLLQPHGVLCYSTTSRREVVEHLTADGEVEKRSRFTFVGWRQWPSLGSQQ